MSSFVLTLLLSFAGVILALFLLTIGWLLTGKQKVTRGSCGRDPTKKRDESCGEDVDCSICNPKKDK